MGKKDFPRIARYWILFKCWIGFHWPRTLVISATYRLFNRRVMKRYQASLHGAFPEHVPLAILYLACDEKYFSEFGVHLVDTALAQTRQVNVHLHVYNLSEAYRAKLEARRAAPGAERFSFTWDDLPYAHLNAAQRWYYLASARFIRMYQLLAATAKPVLNLDADGVVVRPLEARFGDWADYDVGIYLRLGNTLDWRKVLASAFFASPSGTGMAFMRDLAFMIAWLLNSRLAYHVDQLLIYYLWRMYTGADKGFRCKTLSQEMADWDCADDSFVWSAKGDRKYLDEKFAQARSA